MSSTNTSIIIDINNSTVISNKTSCPLLSLLFVTVLEISGNALITRNKIYSDIYQNGGDKIAMVHK